MRETGEVLQGGAGIVDGLTGEWRALCERGGNAFPFDRPEWVKAYFRNHGKRNFLLFSVRRDGILDGLFPMIEKRDKACVFPFTVYRGPSDFHLWPSDIVVSRQSDRRAVVKRLWELLKNHRGWDIVEFPNMPEGGAAESLLEAAEEDGYPTHRWEYMHSACISLPGGNGGGDPLQVVRSPSLRRNLRSVLRRVRDDGGMKLMRYCRPEPEVMRRFLELEASPWRLERGSAIVSREKDRRLWEELALAAGEGGYLSLYAIRLKGRIAGISLGFDCRGRHYGLKLGWDPEFRAYSVGHLLVHAIVEDCIRRGVSEYHLMGLRSGWKEQWSKDGYRYSNGYIFRKGLIGRMLKLRKIRTIATLVETFDEREGRIG